MLAKILPFPAAAACCMSSICPVLPFPDLAFVHAEFAELQLLLSILHSVLTPPSASAFTRLPALIELVFDSRCHYRSWLVLIEVRPYEQSRSSWVALHDGSRAFPDCFPTSSITIGCNLGSYIKRSFYGS